MPRVTQYKESGGPLLIQGGFYPDLSTFSPFDLGMVIN